MAFRWSEFPRSTRIGAAIGFVVVLPFVPFLIYAGMAIRNATAEWTRSVAGNGIAKVAGVAAFVLYLLVVSGIPVTLGGFVGSRFGLSK
jgi:hypothetical protein